MTLVRYFVQLQLLLMIISGRLSAGENINWVEWSDAAFQNARDQKKLIILDLQAVWCHWCHVMHDKTYSDQEVGKTITDNFIAIRVDQDARPDISVRYEDYGWPATIIFDSNGKEIAKLSGYQEKGRFLAKLKALVKDPKPDSEDGVVKLVVLDTKFLAAPQRVAAEKFHKDLYNTKYGGWGEIHKFLFGETEEYALRNAWMKNNEESKRAIETLTKALAIIDPVWGGIYQYSVKTWKEPHFEKIPSSQYNALLLYSLGYALTKDPAYLKAAQSIRSFLNTFMKDSTGAYYVSMDADVVQGKHSEGYFKLNDAGRRKIGIPRIDKNLYARENGSYATGLLWLYRLSGDEGALNDARTAVAWVEKNRSIDGGGFKHGELDKGGPYLSDSLEMGRAYLSLYESTAERLHLDKAKAALGFIANSFAYKVDNKIVGYNVSASNLSQSISTLPNRDQNISLARFANLLFQYSGDTNASEVAENAMRFLLNPDIIDAGPTGGILLADTELNHDPVHITVVGAKGDLTAKALFLEALAYPTSYRRVEWWDKTEGNLPRNDVSYPTIGKAAAFACIEGRCSVPLFDPKTLHKKIDGLYVKK